MSRKQRKRNNRKKQMPIMLPNRASPILIVKKSESEPLLKGEYGKSASEESSETHDESSSIPTDLNFNSPDWSCDSFEYNNNEDSSSTTTEIYDEIAEEINIREASIIPKKITIPIPTKLNDIVHTVFPDNTFTNAKVWKGMNPPLWDSVVNEIKELHQAKRYEMDFHHVVHWIEQVAPQIKKFDKATLKSIIPPVPGYIDIIWSYMPTIFYSSTSSPEPKELTKALLGK
jgi:hypothetical protein